MGVFSYKIPEDMSSDRMKSVSDSCEIDFPVSEESFFFFFNTV